MDEGPLPALALPSDCAHLAGEEGVALRGRPLSLGQHEQQLSKDAREGPHVDSRRVALQQDELGRAVPGTCARAHHGAHAQLCEGGGMQGGVQGAVQGGQHKELGRPNGTSASPRASSSGASPWGTSSRRSARAYAAVREREAQGCAPVNALEAARSAVGGGCGRGGGAGAVEPGRRGRARLRLPVLLVDDAAQPEVADLTHAHTSSSGSKSA